MPPSSVRGRTVFQGEEVAKGCENLYGGHQHWLSARLKPAVSSKTVEHAASPQKASFKSCTDACCDRRRPARHTVLGTSPPRPNPFLFPRVFPPTLCFQNAVLEAFRPGTVLTRHAEPNSSDSHKGTVLQTISNILTGLGIARDAVQGVGQQNDRRCQRQPSNLLAFPQDTRGQGQKHSTPRSSNSAHVVQILPSCTASQAQLPKHGPDVKAKQPLCVRLQVTRRKTRQVSDSAIPPKREMRAACCAQGTNDILQATRTQA